MANSDSTYAIEARIIKNINRLNELYYECLEDDECDSSDVTYTEWTNLIATVNNDVTLLNSRLPASDSNANANVKKYSDIMTKYKDIQNMRTQMQNKIDDIKNTGTVSHTSNVLLQADTALYANLGWSLLATSVLYYVFMKVSK